MKIPEDNLLNRYQYLIWVIESMNNDLESLKSIVSALSLKGDYTVRDIEEKFKKSTREDSLMWYCLTVKSKLENTNRIRTARGYLSAVKSLYKYTKGKDVFLCDIEARFMQEYEEYLNEEGLKPNSISFYMRQIRALYKRAIKDKLIKKKDDNPFEKVFTGVAESEKRALNSTELKRVAELESTIDEKIEILKTSKLDDRTIKKSLNFNYRLKKSLYYFLFCYHARGMSYVDLCYLRKSDINGDFITYRRKKQEVHLK